MANHLQDEKSPYLLQHANNPVDWYPWGTEALERARREDKPVLVSIGYSACHWCHVMAHESFENGDTARLMNERLVNIKVDREERPDIDSIYMEAVQVLTGQGGWPLNVFLLPDGRPYFGGTYFPPAPRHGLPSWTQVVEGVSRAYREQQADVLQNAHALTDYLKRAQGQSGGAGMPDIDVLRTAYDSAMEQVDWLNGGFGGAPKFPQPLGLDLMLRLHHRFGEPRALDFVLLTLRQMAAGGIFDQLGGGFHRYSVDAVWLVPHFEKMLYDNALLARTYLHAYQLTGDRQYASVAGAIFEYLLRDLISPEGAFYSAEDADSEGVEGKFYLWTPEEVLIVLSGDEARAVSLQLGITTHGNLEGKTLPTAANGSALVAEQLGMPVDKVQELLNSGRSALLAARSQRQRPAKDTKILAGWNGLAIRALAEGGSILRWPELTVAAERAARFVLEDLRPGGHLVRSYREGPSAIPAFLEDYAFLIEALVSLYETTFEVWYLEQAEGLSAQAIDRFWDKPAGAFFDTEAGAGLIVRPRSLFDNPIPSGSSAIAFGLLRLAALTGDSRYEELGSAPFRLAAPLLARAPLACSYLLSALDFHLSPPAQIAIVPGDLDDGAALWERVFERYLPNRVLAVGRGDRPELLTGRAPIDGRATAYMCEHFACQLPVTDAEAFDQQLAAL